MTRTMDGTARTLEQLVRDMMAGKPCTATKQMQETAKRIVQQTPDRVTMDVDEWAKGLIAGVAGTNEPREVMR